MHLLFRIKEWMRWNLLWQRAFGRSISFLKFGKAIPKVL
jgi:hypothetical protein